MSVKIRLKRMGKRNLPFYRLVVMDSRWRRDGKAIANIGWYDPVKKPAQMSFQEAEIYKWLEKGAQLSETARSLLKKQGILDRFRSGEYKEILARQTESSVRAASSASAPATPAPPSPGPSAEPLEPTVS
ncbi:MAG: 30S ribosomal protein S16 [Candidatus Omnitrophica bacterium]|nr:30S ribosomal protein S16 [Candidatus Omnitrophota bacterium]